ncbi:ribokinase [Bowdeniella nasicola]|uniref:Deoxyribokinase n=1 Tax=Bowdeniella nasicola TaxID=208480 RepID=A0A1Q5PZ99_9ACTO|nr:ribokinase [Bowdeniella nasicola]OKL52944.1 ribokinase [Bowdeniella nasicola]
MTIAVIGSNMVDLITYIDRMPADGETVEAPDFEMGCGGKGANQAVAAAKLGSEVLMLTRVGDDIFADNTVANFERFGIDTRCVLRTEGPSGVAPIFVDKDSHNRILIIKGANAKLSPADIDAAAEDLKRAKLIVLQLEVPLETVYAAIDFGGRHDIPVLLNPAPACADLAFDQVARCTYFMPNEPELALLAGMPVDTLEQVEAAARKVAASGVANVIVTLGRRGVMWLADGQVQTVGGLEVQAVDTTGAGDAFIGCFSHSVVSHGDVAKALAEANRYAADSVTRRGTQTSYADEVVAHPGA